MSCTPYYHSHPHTHSHPSHGHGSHGHGHHGGHGHHHNQKSTVLALSQQTVSASPSDPIILAADKEGKFPPNGLNFTVTTNETTVNIENLNYVDQKLNLNVEIPNVNNPPVYGDVQQDKLFGGGIVSQNYDTSNIFKVEYYLIIKNNGDQIPESPILLSDGLQQTVEIKDGYTFQVQAKVVAKDSMVMYSSKIGRNEEVKITFSVPNTSITSEWVANITYTVDNQWGNVCTAKGTDQPCNGATGGIDSTTGKCSCYPNVGGLGGTSDPGL